MDDADGWDLPHLVPWLIYSALYLCIMYLGLKDQLEQNYPAAFIAFDVACSVLNWLAIVFFALRTQSAILHRWAQILFPVVVLDLVVGVTLDAILPPNHNLAHDGLAWVASLALSLACVSPAYYAGFRLSFSKQKLPGRRER